MLSNVTHDGLKRNALRALLFSSASLVACAGATILGTDPGTGLIVTVRKGPIQPVAREGEENTAPVAGATVQIRLLDAGGRLTVTTGSEGRISTLLKPGAYEVRVVECQGALALPDPDTTLVVPGGFALVRLECDTGIR